MTRRFGKELSVLQMGSTSEQYIIHSEILNIGALRQVFESMNIEKVFFDGAQDVEMIRRCLGFTIRNIHDVSVAYHVVHPSAEKKGLNTILQEQIGVNLSKRYQRADWSLRPLTPEMIAYAAADIAYLVPLRDLLIPKLVSSGKLEDFHAYCDSFNCIRTPRPEVEEMFSFARIIGNKRLDNVQCLIIKRLEGLRYSFGREINRPPHFVFTTEEILGIAEIRPLTLNSFRSFKMSGIPRDQRERIRENVMRIVRQSIDDCSNRPEIYEQEVTKYLRLYTRLGRKNLNLMNPDLSVNIEGTIEDFRARERLLAMWTTRKSQELKKQEQFVLSPYTINLLSTLDFSNRTDFPLIHGIKEHFRVQYREELLNLLRNPAEGLANVKLSKRA